MKKYWIFLLMIMSSQISFAENSKTKTFIYVPGFLNEFLEKKFPDSQDHRLSSNWKPISYYFQSMTKVINDQFKANPVFMDVMSSVSVEDNAKKIMDKLIKEYSNDEVVLIAHSKGGLETLYAYLKYEKELEKIVKYIVLIQAAIGGDPLFSSIDDEIDGTQQSNRWIASFGKKCLSYWFSEGMSSLDAKNAKNLFTPFTEHLMTSDQRAKYKNKIFYVPTALENPKPEDFSNGVNYMYKTCCTNDFKSGVVHDGLLRVKDQVLKVQGEVVGTVLPTYSFDHMGAVVEGFSASNLSAYQWMTDASLRNEVVHEQRQKQKEFAESIFERISEFLSVDNNQ